VNPDLTLKWNKLLRDVVPDGCGVCVPISGPSNTDPNSCRFGSTFGVDPQTNFNGSATIFEESSSSPTALPDGSILFGAVDFYDFGRGHLFKFDSTGKYLASYDWGWDTTPAVYPHDGTYSILTKDNGHVGGNYCTDPIPFCAAPSPPPNFIVQVSANMEVEWEFESTNTESCTRNPDGSLTCVSDHPNGFEWCTNMPAIDSNGTVYVNSGDGNVYELPQPPPGTPMGTVITQPGATIFLTSAVGAAYTPLVIGPDGRFYTQNDGHLFVVGN
jgi:outer membrane protein assembly factor BamB